MGTCVSSHTKSSENMKRYVWFNNRSKSNHGYDREIPPSPIKHEQIDGNVAVKPQMMPFRLHSAANSRDFGSKEETFFDSQAWLESDCESDFMSVNGEFTPSRRNTPMHHDFSAGTPPIKSGAPAPDDDEKPSMSPSATASPIKKKKRLSELFSESLRENRNHDEENAELANETVAAGSLKVAAVRRGDSKSASKRERWVEIVHVQNCLPRVLSSCRPVTSHQTQVRRK